MTQLSKTKISINYTTIAKMLDLLQSIKTDSLAKTDIRVLLTHDDYKIEFNRYKNRVSVYEFTDYLLNIKNIDPEKIENIDLKTHHPYYLHAIENINYYIKNTDILSAFNKDAFQKQINIALQGLPRDIELDELNFIFTIGIGQSFGYVYKNNMHFDYLQLIKDTDFKQFSSALAHEVHHIGMQSFIKRIDFNKMSIEDFFYFIFSGEGLAVKYCNNAEGILSKIINENKNVGLDKKSWDYLNSDFDNTFKRFKLTIEKIRCNKIDTKELLLKEINDYWFSTDAKDDKGGLFQLKHSRIYSFGNEIWGIIHDCFGKDKVYETLENISAFPDVYNKAIELLGRNDYKI